MDHRIALLHLSLIPGVGSAKVAALVAQLTQEQLCNLYTFTEIDFVKAGITQQTAQAVVVGLRDTTYLDQELKLIEQYGVTWCTIFDEQYPETLKTIHLPPPILYWQGDIQLPQTTIAFVGSRAASPYGKSVVRKLVPPLVENGWGIVSGGAYGVDTVAHQATVDAGGRTFVVLGSGLLRQYPVPNKKLFARVAAMGGAVISTFPLTMEAHPHNFPARNRVIAGLSQGTVVVRAAAKSGALITADYALSQGRSVFAVPGLIEDPLSAGCHKLLQQGARLVDGPEAIFEEFGLIEQQMKLIPSTNKPVDPLVAACARPKTIDELLSVTKMAEPELKEALFELQLSGKIEQNFAGLWHSV